MVMLFALGFGSACLVKVGKAQDIGGEQWFDQDFVIEEDGGVLRLENQSREKGYLTLVTRMPGSGAADGSLKVVETGPVTIAKDDVQKITVYRLEAVALWEGDGRPCEPPFLFDCPIPIPPPPPEGYAHPPRP
jgi:hypothetical protein